MSKLYASLEGLLAFRFHVKRYKINHQQKLMSAKAGYHQAVRKGRGMTFTEVRPYQAGDDIRHIDWKVSARTLTTHTKVFTEELEKPIICVTEQTPQLFFGSQVRFKSVQALNISAILGWLTIQNGDRFGAQVFTDTQNQGFPAKAHHKTLMGYFHAALALQASINSPLPSSPTASVNWVSVLNALTKQANSGHKLFLIGDFLEQDEAFFQTLLQLKKRNQCTLIHLFDPIEKQLPALSNAPDLTLSNGHQSISLPTRKAERNAYQQQYQQAWEKLTQRCHQHHLPLVEIDTSAPALAQLIQQKVIV